MGAFDSISWFGSGVAASDALNKSANLSDVENPAEALGNLGAAKAQDVINLSADISGLKTGVAALNEEVGLSQILKQNGGQLYLNGGYATTNCKPTFGAAQTLLFTYEVSEAELTSMPISIVGNVFVWNTPEKGFGVAVNSSKYMQCGFHWDGTNADYVAAQTAQFADGKPHAWALVCGKNATNGFFKLYRDGVLIESKMSLALFDDFTPNYGFYIGRAQGKLGGPPAKGRISRVAFFNFDVSESSAPYTLADYKSGKAVPPTLYNPQAAQRAELALENYTIARNTTTRLIKDVSGNSYDATVRETDGTLRGTYDTSVAAFVDEIKTQIAQSTATTE